MFKTIIARTICAAAVLSLGMSVAPNALAEEIVVVGWGGASQDALRKTFFQPYVAESGNNIVEDSWNGGVGTLRAKVQGGSVPWDLVQVESEELIIGCEEGLFVAIDWDKIGGRDGYLDAGANECGVGALGWAIVLAYDGDVLTEGGPRSWKDFFDTSAYPGKRALRKGPKFNLEFALYADGVPAGSIYSVLSTDEGVERAFAKLHTIKNDLIWWEAGAQPQQLLAAGEVVMTAAYSGRVANVNADEGKNFKIVWPGSIYAMDSWVIMKGGPNSSGAMNFLAFMGDPQLQADWMQAIPYGAASKAAYDLVSAETIAQLPTAPANLAVQLEVGTDFWVENVGALSERFNSWVDD